MAVIYDLDTLNYQDLEKYHFVKNGKITEDYWKLNLLYRKVVELYLEEKLGLSLSDQKICEILEPSMIIPKEMETYYFRNSSYKTMYLRNHFYIERLNENDMSLLKRKLEEKVIDDELKEMVVKTLKNVILYQEDYGENVKFSRDGLYDSERIENGALILIIYYCVFETEENGFMEKYGNITKEVRKIKEEIDTKGKEKIDSLFHTVLVDDKIEINHN